MLIVSRKPIENIMIGDNVVVTVLGVRGKIVRLGITAPREIPVHREEIYVKINQQRAEESASNNDQ